MSCAHDTEISLASALLTVSRTADGLRWDARYLVSGTFEGGALTFAVPLLPCERLVPAPGVTPLGGERITGLCIAADALRDHALTVAFVQPGAGPILGAPVAAGSTVQVIDGPSSSDARLEIDAVHGLEHHVGFVAPRTVGHSAREEARRWTGTDPHLTKNPAFVRGIDVQASGGLSGRLVGPTAHARGNALAIFLVFLAVVGALAYAARRLRRAASIERADALLAAEIDACTVARATGRP